MSPVLAEHDLSRARHDLRTVVNHLDGYVMLLREEDEAWLRRPEVSRLLDAVAESARGIIRALELSVGQPHGQTPDDVFRTLREALSRVANDLHATLGNLREIEEAREHPDVQRLQTAAERLSSFVLVGETQATGAVAQEPGGGALTPRPPNILIVDEDRGNRELMGRMLRRLSYKVTASARGSEALVIAARTEPDVILLDLMLPDTEGILLLRQVKQLVPLVPVLIVSARSEVDYVQDCIDAGAEDYFIKPFIPVLLRVRIAAAIDRKRYRQMLAQVLPLTH